MNKLFPVKTTQMIHKQKKCTSPRIMECNLKLHRNMIFFTYTIYKDQFDKHWVGEDVGKLSYIASWVVKLVQLLQKTNWHCQNYKCMYSVIQQFRFQNFSCSYTCMCIKLQVHRVIHCNKVCTFLEVCK